MKVSAWKIFRHAAQTNFFLLGILKIFRIITTFCSTFVLFSFIVLYHYLDLERLNHISAIILFVTGLIQIPLSFLSNAFILYCNRAVLFLFKGTDICTIEAYLASLWNGFRFIEMISLVVQTHLITLSSKGFYIIKYGVMCTIQIYIY